MKELRLTRGLVALVDDADFDWLNQWNWYAKAQTEGNKFYACRTSVAARYRTIIYMHRLILGLKDGDKILGDHRNGDTLDNQRANLRIATHLQNAANRGPRRDNTSGFIGVVLRQKDQKWVALFQVNKKRYFLGSFDTPQEAQAAYRKACLQHRGEFARVI